MLVFDSAETTNLNANSLIQPIPLTEPITSLTPEFQQGSIVDFDRDMRSTLGTEIIQLASCSRSWSSPQFCKKSSPATPCSSLQYLLGLRNLLLEYFAG